MADEFVPYFPYFFNGGFHPGGWMRDSVWDLSCAVCQYCVHENLVGINLEDSLKPSKILIPKKKVVSCCWGSGLEQSTCAFS